jgi:arylsulfatase A-like enzyme
MNDQIPTVTASRSGPPEIPRRDFIRTAAGTALGLTLGFPRLDAPGSVPAAGATPGRPNILWVTMEDTSPHFIGAYGNTSVHTPTLDRLAAEGVRFNSAFSTAPVCSPSRSAIITGVLADELGTGQHRSACPIPGFIKGFPAYLRQAGYYASNNKKTDYNVADENGFVREAWDECSDQATWRKRKRPDQPFFSVFNLMGSHQSRTMTNPYAWYRENVWKQLPAQARTSPESIEVPPFYRDTPELRKHLCRVHNSLNLTDIHIGKILEDLKQDGLADDTIVFCFADHGEGIPRGKSSALGLGFQIPFFIYFPAKYRHLSPWPVGQATDELISSSEDVAPTVLSLCGVEIPRYMTGRALLGDQRQPPRRYVWASRNRIDESPDVSRCATDGRYFYTRVFLPQLPQVKYQKYADVSDILRGIRADYDAGLLNPIQAELIKPGQPGEYLHDLKDDPWQIHNLAGDPVHQAQLETMRQNLQQHLLASRDIHFMPESASVPVGKKQMLYEFRKDDSRYPFARILAAANLVGTGAGAIPAQLALLKDGDATVRYWAAVGLDAQGDAVKPHRENVLAALDDAEPSVRVVIAGIAGKQFDDPRAEPLLTGWLRGKDEMTALQALQVITYMGEKARPYAEALHAELKGHHSYDFTSSAETTLHFLEGAPLFYQDAAAFTPVDQKQPDPHVHFTT